jgi:hypothetical protein
LSLLKNQLDTVNVLLDIEPQLDDKEPNTFSKSLSPSASIDGYAFECIIKKQSPKKKNHKNPSELKQ